MSVLEILKRAQACGARLPARTVSPNTLQAYRDTFARMWREGTLDALRPGCAIDTFYHRRAALHVGILLMLGKFSARCYAAAERNDVAATRRWGRMLVRSLDRIEPALALNPPLAAGVSALKSPCSRWRQSAGPHPKRGRLSKKNVLALLPTDWDTHLWQAASVEWSDPEDQEARDALAIGLLVPVRPAELVEGPRSHGWSPGVAVERRSPRCLALTVVPVKSHRGRYGTGTTTVLIDPTKAGDAAAYLTSRCASAGGQLVVSISSKNAFRKKLARLGEHALPEYNVVITPYVLRDQAIADYKVTLGAGVAVAAAAGQCTDRTQAKYGYAAHGRKRRGLIGVESARTPRAGNVARAHELAAARRLLPTQDEPPGGSGS
jgi:hypothetical protein